MHDNLQQNSAEKYFIWSAFAGVLDILSSQKSARILSSPTYFIALNSLGESSVNIVVRAWVNAEDYWNVFFSMNEKGFLLRHNDITNTEINAKGGSSIFYMGNH